MSLQDKSLHLCNCNGTMPLDGDALARALELAGPLPIHRALCQKELAALSEHRDRAEQAFDIICRRPDKSDREALSIG